MEQNFSRPMLGFNLFKLSPKDSSKKSLPHVYLSWWWQRSQRVGLRLWDELDYTAQGRRNWRESAFPVFGRSVDTFSTRGGQIMPTTLLCAPPPPDFHTSWQPCCTAHVRKVCAAIRLPPSLSPLNVEVRRYGMVCLLKGPKPPHLLSRTR